jgi:hypothetical protein
MLFIFVDVPLWREQSGPDRYVNNIENQRPRNALYPFLPVTISEDLCKLCHLGALLGSVEALILKETREVIAFHQKSFQSSSFGLEPACVLT